MKSASVGAASLPVLLAFLSSACSDPPSPPAQAAIWVKSDPAAGQTCTTTHNVVGIPSKYSGSVLQELNCDLSIGCKPDDYIVVDRDQGTSVSCTVSPESGNFGVQLSLTVDGSGSPDGISMNFNLSGTLGPSGGMAAVNESDNAGMGGGGDMNCTVTIAPPKGVIGKGKIWGSFECPNFRDPKNIGDTGCDVTGQFLFENCGG